MTKTKLTEEQIRGLKQTQANMAASGFIISDEDLFRMGEEYYGSGRDQIIREIARKADREGVPIEHLLDEAFGPPGGQKAPRS